MVYITRDILCVRPGRTLLLCDLQTHNTVFFVLRDSCDLRGWFGRLSVGWVGGDVDAL